MLHCIASQTLIGLTAYCLGNKHKTFIEFIELKIEKAHYEKLLEVEREVYDSLACFIDIIKARS